MKRFLSLVLSTLFVFQLGNASCDAASHYRNNPSNYSMGATPQGQPMVIMQASPYVPQQQPIINVTAPEPTPQHITIQQPEIKQDFKMKVDATTTADKLWSWLKFALTLVLGCAVLKTILPAVTLFTGHPNPLETMQGWGRDALKWVKGIWDEEPIDKENQNKGEQEEQEKEQEKEIRGSDYSENGSTNELWWGASLWQKLAIPLATFVMMRGSGVGKTL